MSHVPDSVPAVAGLLTESPQRPKVSRRGGDLRSPVSAGSGDPRRTRVTPTSGRIGKKSELWQVRLPTGPLLCVVWGLIVTLPATADELSQGWSASPPRAVASEAVRDGQLVQRQASGAFGKGVYLVAWCDGSRQVDRPTADIYCARVEAESGKLLDPKGIVVCSAPDLQEWPEVAFDGQDFLVAWQDFRGGKCYDIYAARVSPGGKVLDKDGFTVAAAPYNQGRPDVAFAGGRYLIVWMDARHYPVYGIFAARVTPAGEVLDLKGLAFDVEEEAKVAEARPPKTKWMGDCSSDGQAPMPVAAHSHQTRACR